MYVLGSDLSYSGSSYLIGAPWFVINNVRLMISFNSDKTTALIFVSTDKGESPALLDLTLSEAITSEGCFKYAVFTQGEIEEAANNRWVINGESVTFWLAEACWVVSGDSVEEAYESLRTAVFGNGTVGYELDLVDLETGDITTI